MSQAEGAVRLLGADPRRFSSVAARGEDLFVSALADGDCRSTHVERVLVVTGVDAAVDAVPELSGSISQVLRLADRRRVVLWSEDPNFTQHVLVEGAAGWQPITPELRVAGPYRIVGGEQLIIPAYDGIRIGAALADPAQRTWWWVNFDATGSLYPITVDSAGATVAVRRPVNGDPTLVAIDRRGSRDVGRVPADTAAPATVRAWQGAAGRLEGLTVTPPGPGPWPLVVDVHGGPNHTLVAGYPHDLERWRQAGFAAIAPEYAAAGIGGARRRLSAWAHAGLPETDPNVEDVDSAITAFKTEAITPSVFLFGWSWGARVVNRMVSTGRTFQAEVCWEGVADLRLLDSGLGGDPFRRHHWGTPEENPVAWDLASPVTRAANVRTPMLLLYGENSRLVDQGEAWRAALAKAGVPVELWIYPGGHMPAPDVLDELYNRAVDWFRHWNEDSS